MQYARQDIEQLMLEKLAGTISNEDDALLVNALMQDAGLQEVYEQLKAQLQKASVAGILPEANAEAAWELVAPQLRARTSRMSRMRTPLAVAAVWICVCIAAYLLWPSSNQQVHTPTLADVYKNSLPVIDQVTLQLNNQTIVLGTDDTAIDLQNIGIQQRNDQLFITTVNNQPASWILLSVPAAQQRTIVLADGTTVTLNAGTKLMLPTAFTQSQREVLLDGEAYFHVTKNAQQPFVVHARNTDIRVLGTRFNVNSYDSTQTVTSLVEGSVQASHLQQQTLLKPGQEAVYAGDKFTVQPFDSLNTLSWMQGVYYFDQTPLSVLENVIPRWFNQQVVFETAALKNKQLNGALYRDQPLSAFLKNLQLTTDISYTIKAGVVYLR